jgi:HlyD family secretion protein
MDMLDQDRFNEQAATETQPSRLRRWRLPFAVVAVLVAAGLVAWWQLGAAPALRYTTAPVTRATVATAVTATGTVNPETVVQVGSYVSGVVREVSCDYNTVVTSGQLCAKIDPRLYEPVVEQAKANLAVAKAQLGKDRANLEYAKAAYQRSSKLVARGNISQDALENALNAFHQAQAQVTLDQAQIEQRQAALDAAQVNLDYTNITSPVNGTVVSRNVNVGQTVAASFQTPTLFLIATDLTKMQVDTNVSESDIGAVHVGDAAHFTVEAFPKRRFDGTVTQIRQAPIAVQNVVTYDVVIGAPNPDLVLKPGMTATVRIVTAEHKDVLTVPSQALRFSPNGPAAAEQSGPRVWVLRDGASQPVAVTTGLSDTTRTEITGGALQEGDKVVVSASQAGSGGNSAANTGQRPRMFGFR